MFWSKLQWETVALLAKKFGLDQCVEPVWRPSIQPYDLLEHLEHKLEHLLNEHGEEYFYRFSREKTAVRRLTYSELATLSYGIDYNLELRKERELVSEDNYPVIYYCLVALPKIQDEGLEKENHGYGYHIHYVLIQKRNQRRTNIVFTFNPAETARIQHRLYWEYHGHGLKKKPERFGKRRCNAIYDTSCGFLSIVPKQEFRSPKSSANVLWPMRI